MLDERDEWYWLHNASSLGERRAPVKRKKWWKRPRVFYTCLCLIVGAMVGLAVTGIVLGLDGMEGFRPNRGNSGGDPPSDDVSATDSDGNDQGTGGFMGTREPSPSPTLAPTVAPTISPTNPPTAQPIRGPRTTPLSFYVIGDGT